MALLKEVKRETLRTEWRAISIVFAQLVLLVLIVFQLLQIAGLHIDFYLKQVAIKPTGDISDFIILGIALVAFALLYLSVKKSQPALFRAESRAPGIIKEQAKQKLAKVRKEPQAAALLLIELSFIVVLVLAIMAYLDPEIELIPWSRAGIDPPVTTVANAVIAVIFLAGFYYLYRFTAAYRKGAVSGKEPASGKKSVSGKKSAHRKAVRKK